MPIRPIVLIVMLIVFPQYGIGGGDKVSKNGIDVEITESVATTMQLITLPKLTVQKIAGGSKHTCAVLSDGAIKCWGKNSYGELGNGTITDYSNVPVNVTGISKTATVSLRNYNTCALLSEGTVKCWGYNDRGQLGNGTYTDSSIPVRVSGISTATGIAAGVFHSCALLSNGTVKCWGYNAYGQLGNGTYTDSSIPVRVSGISTATAIAAGADHSCALLSDGTIKCWGWNAQGQVGTGTDDDNFSIPMPVVGISEAVAVTNGDYHTCALLADGAVKCWGLNGESMASIEVTATPLSAVERVPTVTTVVARRNKEVHLSWAPVEGATSYSVYYAAASGVTPDNYTSLLGGASQEGITQPSVVIKGLTNGIPYSFIVTAIKEKVRSAASAEVVVIPVADGSSVAPAGLAVVSGDERVRLSWGPVGGGASYSVYYAAFSGVTPDNYASLPGGTVQKGIGDTSVIISGLENGTAYCFIVTGHYSGIDDGQLGDGTYVNSRAPVSVLGISTATTVDAGGNNTCAVLSNGSVKCWGRNISGEIGDGATYPSTNVPVAVSGISTAIDIAVGCSPCALLSDGTVKCWGSNYYGQLGNGTHTDSRVPIAVDGSLYD